MDIEYKIVGFDQVTGNITIEFGEYSLNVAVPVVGGRYIFGDELSNFCKKMAEIHLKQFDIIKRIDNASDISALVEAPTKLKQDEHPTVVYIRKELKATDFYLTVDYPISQESLIDITKYRKTLRSLSSSPEYPNVDLPTRPIVTKS